MGPGAAHAPLDLGALRIVSGKTCWVLYIDALVLDIDGAALDAISIAVKAALADARIPKVELVQGEDPGDEPEYEVDDDPEHATRLDVSGVPVTLSVCRLGSACVVDPTADEEECAAAVVAVAVDASGAVCGISKGREEGVDPTTLMVSSRPYITILK